LEHCFTASMTAHAITILSELKMSSFGLYAGAKARSPSTALLTALSFRAVPRRLRGESGPITDRAAFRLCIAAADCQRLLDDSGLNRWSSRSSSTSSQPQTDIGVQLNLRRILVNQRRRRRWREGCLLPCPFSCHHHSYSCSTVPAASDVVAGSALVATTS